METGEAGLQGWCDRYTCLSSSEEMQQPEARKDGKGTSQKSTGTQQVSSYAGWSSEDATPEG